MIVFGWVIPERLGLSFEFAVAVMLIVLGLINITGVFRVAARRAGATGAVQHSHAHSHGDYVHTHAHGHGPEDHPHAPDKTPVAWLDRTFGSIGLFQLMRPMLVGVVHGLAGSASVALIVLATMTDARWGVVYLLLFGIGTILGMLLITAVMALPVQYGSRRPGNFPSRLRAAAGVLSIAFGLFLAYHVGVTQGLFFGSR
jgi:high-affinity nickel-transport protein